MFNSYNPYVYQTKKFNFSNLLNNASKTLNIINQALLIYKEVKPIFKNASALFKIARGINNISNKKRDYYLLYITIFYLIKKFF